MRLGCVTSVSFGGSFLSTLLILLHLFFMASILTQLRGRLAELAADIQRFVSRCSLEDMELCATLDTRGLDIGSRFDSVSPGRPF